MKPKTKDGITTAAFAVQDVRCLDRAIDVLVRLAGYERGGGLAVEAEKLADGLRQIIKARGVKDT